MLVMLDYEDPEFIRKWKGALDRAFDEGRGEGKEEKALEIARKLLDRGMSKEQVESITGIKLD